MLLAIAKLGSRLTRLFQKNFEIDGSFFIEVGTPNPFYLFRKVKIYKIKAKK